MTDALPPSAQKVQDTLTALGFSCEVKELSASTRTAAEAAEAVGCDVAQIAKSLIFRGKKSGEALLVIASGKNRVNEKRLAALAGEPIGRADADFVREWTGFAIGGVPPLGHARTLRAWIDRDLLTFPAIWAAAGTPHAMFRLTPPELEAMTGGTVADVSGAVHANP